jgi:hypothetical protein
MMRLTDRHCVVVDGAVVHRGMGLHGEVRRASAVAVSPGSDVALDIAAWLQAGMREACVVATSAGSFAVAAQPAIRHGPSGRE